MLITVHYEFMNSPTQLVWWAVSDWISAAYYCFKCINYFQNKMLETENSVWQSWENVIKTDRNKWCYPHFAQWKTIAWLAICSSLFLYTYSIRQHLKNKKKNYSAQIKTKIALHRQLKKGNAERKSQNEKKKKPKLRNYEKYSDERQ